MNDLVESLLPALHASVGRPYGIAEGGASAKGTADSQSDLDLYVFSNSVEEGSTRSELVAAAVAAAGGEATELTSWDSNDPAMGGGTDLTVAGTRIEVWFRSIRAVDAEARRALAGDFTRTYVRWTVMGFFSPVILADLAAIKTIDDPDGVLARWTSAVASYPEPLREALLNRFVPEATFWIGNFHYRTAVQRCDLFYTTGIVRQTVEALIQTVFAANRVYFPGEKKLAKTLAALPELPEDFAERAQALLAGGVEPTVAALEAQAKELERLVSETVAMVS